jgi:hypothetical protein
MLQYTRAEDVKVLRQGILVLVILGGAGLLSASGIPQSSCVFNDSLVPNDGFNCNLYPSNPSGNFDGDVVVQFPAGWSDVYDPITSGYLVLTHDAANLVSDPGNFYGADDPHESDWTQILEWEPVGAGSATQMELFTVGCNSATNPNDTSCFPAYSTLLADGYFDVEPTNGVYNYNPCPGCTVDHSYVLTFLQSPASEVPEPSTFAIAFGGIAILAGLGRRKYPRRRQRSLLL